MNNYAFIHTFTQSIHFKGIQRNIRIQMLSSLKLQWLTKWVKVSLWLLKVPPDRFLQFIIWPSNDLFIHRCIDCCHSVASRQPWLDVWNLEQISNELVWKQFPGRASSGSFSVKHWRLNPDYNNTLVDKGGFLSSKRSGAVYGFWAAHHKSWKWLWNFRIHDNNYQIQ